MARTRATETRLRDAQAVEYRRAGMHYHQIAAKLEMKSASSAYDAVKRGMREFYQEEREDGINQEDGRLDDALRVAYRVMNTRHAAYTTAGIVITWEDEAGKIHPVYDDATNLAAAKLVVEISQSRRRMRGWDAPSRRTVQVVTEDVIDAQIRALEEKHAAMPGGQNPPAIEHHASRL